MPRSLRRAQPRRDGQGLVRERGTGTASSGAALFGLLLSPFRRRRFGACAFGALARSSDVSLGHEVMLHRDVPVHVVASSAAEPAVIQTLRPACLRVHFALQVWRQRSGRSLGRWPRAHVNVGQLLAWHAELRQRVRHTRLGQSLDRCVGHSLDACSRRSVGRACCSRRGVRGAGSLLRRCLLLPGSLAVVAIASSVDPAAVPTIPAFGLIVLDGQGLVLLLLLDGQGLVRFLLLDGQGLVLFLLLDLFHLLDGQGLVLFLIFKGRLLLFLFLNGRSLALLLLLLLWRQGLGPFFLFFLLLLLLLRQGLGPFFLFFSSSGSSFTLASSCSAGLVGLGSVAELLAEAFFLLLPEDLVFFGLLRRAFLLRGLFVFFLLLFLLLFFWLLAHSHRARRGAGPHEGFVLRPQNGKSHFFGRSQEFGRPAQAERRGALPLLALPHRNLHASGCLDFLAVSRLEVAPVLWDPKRTPVSLGRGQQEAGWPCWATLTGQSLDHHGQVGHGLDRLQWSS